MLCEKCGKEIPDGSTFCGYCGAQTVLKKKNKKPFIIGGCFITLVAIFCIVFFVGKHIKEERQEADRASAETIAVAIEKVISNETVNTDIQQYSGIVISLEGDLKYLPQSFQEQFQKACGEIPNLQYTKDNAAGFSFMVDKNGKVSVYIASDKRLDEWQMYPEVSDRYYDGEKQKPDKTDLAGTINNSEYSYVRLISKESPILGYWQGDYAGMYVGYDTTAEEEGFVIYLYTSDKWVQVLHYYEGYSATGGMGQIHYSKDGSKVDVVVEDESHITIHYQNDSYEGDEYISEYTFTKGELDDSLMERFGGKWMGGISDWGVSPDCEITYDNGYHFTERHGNGGAVIQCVHERKEMDGQVINPTIVLYNGVDSLCFLSPYGQMEVQEGYCFNLREFCENTDKMEYKNSIVNADGGEYDLYREESAEFKMQKVLLAYEDYVNDLDTDYYGDKVYFTYHLIYVDNDEIPELVIYPEYGCIVCSYEDGKVKELVNSSSSTFCYIEKGGYYRYYGMFEDEIYAKYEKGTYEILACRVNDVETPIDYDFLYYIGDDEVSEEEYLDYINTLPDGFVSVFEDTYPTIYEAYQNLN